MYVDQQLNQMKPGLTEDCWKWIRIVDIIEAIE